MNQQPTCGFERSVGFFTITNTVNQMGFSQKDIEQAQKHGVGLEQLEEQLENFKQGFPYSHLTKAATVGCGIERFDTERIQYYDNVFDKGRESLTIEKFVPASGAASRMFKDLYEFLSQYDKAKHSLGDFPQAKQLIDHIDDFAFAKELDKVLALGGIGLEESLKLGDYKRIVNAILSSEGLDYGQNPKALILFHRYEEQIRTSMEEHLVEAALYCRNSQGETSISFTLSPNHFDKAQNLLDKVLPYYERTFSTKYHISLSSQKSSTDTIAVKLDNTPARNEKGELIFRPSGHGALIENLQDTNADIVFIKNIDNVSKDSVKRGDMQYKKMLGGLLIEIRQIVYSALRDLETGTYSSQRLSEIAHISQEKLHLNPPQRENFENDKAYADSLFALLNRPIRVCAMVKNEGQPGGGPFWVRNKNGEESLQIVEKAQVDLDNADQRSIFETSTHFNPVDIVCSIKDHNGNKYNLKDYIDHSAGFISEKTQQSEKIKIQERPGLWNGAMADWITLFVETPIEYFNPVKTVNDLLKLSHQYQG